MSITQKDIAGDLGISFITVNRVFNNSGYVSEKLKKRVLEYARKKNYIPHRASQILVRNKTRTIALFASTWPSFFWRDIEKGVILAAEYLKSLNYDIRFYMIPMKDTGRYCSLLKRELRKGLDAAAFVYQSFFNMDEIIGIAEKAGIPFLFFNMDDPGKRGLAYVGTDSGKGGRLAANFIGKVFESKTRAEALIIFHKKPETNKKNPVALPDPNRQRLDGFLSVMKEQYPSIHCSLAYVNDDNDDHRIERQLRHIFGAGKKKPEAVYFLPSCLSCFHRFLEKNDFKESVILQHDIDDEAIACLDKKLITAVVYQDPVLQGYMAVKYLEKVLEIKTAIPRREIEISHTMIFRENTGFSRNHFLLLEPDTPVI